MAALCVATREGEGVPPATEGDWFRPESVIDLPRNPQPVLRPLDLVPTLERHKRVFVEPRT